MIVRNIGIIILFELLSLPVLAQNTLADEEEEDEQEMVVAETPVEIKVGTAVYQGDTIPHAIYPVLPKYIPITFKNERERRNYNRLVYNVKKVLPWAKRVRLTVIETYSYMETLPDEKSRKEHLRQVESGLKKQYGPTLKRFTRSQGRLLVKLVNRECNMTGYNIAKAFIGSFKANFYQGIALLFGNSLNKKYDPEGDDKYTERVVQLVEAGVL